MITEKYINLFTDFGFKKLFGEENSKAYLIAFLNTLLPEKHHITELTYTKNEQLGSTPADRKAIFDLHCKNDKDEYFIVELQKAKQNYFKERSIYYATFPIQQQAQKGEWDFKLQAVYTIGILDFEFDEDKQEVEKEVVHRVQLKDQHNKVFYDKCTFIYLTLPHFNKTADELETEQEKWFYLFKNLHKLDAIPAKLQQALFVDFFEKAQIAHFTPQEREAYEESAKYYRDLKNVIDTAAMEAREEGKQEGIELGKQEGEKVKALEIARNMLNSGLEIVLIVQLTGLPENDIEALRSAY
jgi:predicted transposase/invertase (TIGR01784 family)